MNFGLSAGLPARISTAQFNVQQGKDELIALGNRVSSDMGPAELGQLQQREKELTLGNISQEISADYMQAWDEANLAQRKKAQEQQQRMSQLGVLFG